MSKIRKKFIIYAMSAIFVLLTVLLGTLNTINFTLVAEDADRVTQMLCDGRGQFGGRILAGQAGPAGPESPELAATLRHFTVAFDKDGNAQMVAFKISAVDQQTAVDWARSLLGKRTGWTKTTYRYRVYTVDKKTFVTVIDQGRELLSPYRILRFSAIGELFFLVLSFLVLLFVSRRLLQPLEETDRKQKRFLADVEKAFRVPLTVMHAGTELLEKEHGATDVTRAMHRQVKQMTALVEELEALTILDKPNENRSAYNLSDLCRRMIDESRAAFAQRDLQCSAEIAPDVSLVGDNEAMRRCIAELLENQTKFALHQASVTLQQTQDRIQLTFENDTDLPDGSADQVFDRFTRLKNAENVPGAGLGLSYVKDMVKQQDGRVTAGVENGRFIVSISL